MKTKGAIMIFLALAINSMPAPLQAGEADAAKTGKDRLPVAEASTLAPPLLVTIDPRVELLSLIFRLAGNPEYTRGRVGSYTEDVEAQFGTFRESAVVQLARELRNKDGVSYDACMSMAVHLSDAYDLKPRIPLSPWPESLDRRWTAQSVTNFLSAARQFVRDTHFPGFFEKHRSLYETAESRMKTLMEREGHLEWFNAYFGERPQATFRVALGMLNGGNCYGPHFRDASGREELFCVLGVWQTDSQGLPEFNKSVLETVVHEFCHSYANPLIDHHEQELHAAGQTLFSRVEARMRPQAYGEAITMLRESLVRACVVRYVLHYNGNAAAERAVREEEKRGFLWMRELSDLLSEFEAHRDQYPELESFAPRLVSFFKEYATDFSSKQTALDAKRPKVVSMVPPNGAADVSPSLTELRVTFDRPMRDGSWSMCGGGPNFPEGTAPPHYNAERTTWTVPIKLKPDWDYEFGLNCPSYNGFCSEDGTPLEPIPVSFRTGSGKSSGDRSDGK